MTEALFLETAECEEQRMEFDDLKALHHNGFSYEYEYDPFGNITRVLLAGEEICRNEYAPYNGSHVSSN